MDQIIPKTTFKNLNIPGIIINKDMGYVKLKFNDGELFSNISYKNINVFIVGDREYIGFFAENAYRIRQTSDIIHIDLPCSIDENYNHAQNQTDGLF